LKTQQYGDLSSELYCYLKSPVADPVVCLVSITNFSATQYNSHFRIQQYQNTVKLSDINWINNSNFRIQQYQKTVKLSNINWMKT